MEKRRHDLMPEHQKVQKKSQKIQSIQDKSKKYAEREWQQHKKRCGRSKRSSGKKEERFRLFLSDRVDKNKMADAEMAAEQQSLQAGEERRGSNASQTGDGCLEALWQQLIVLGANGVEAFVERLQREMGAAQG